MDLVTVAIGVGLVLSLVLSELFGLVAGGMVVPGYLAIFLHRPLVIATTIVAAMLTWAIARWIARYVIVYGRRRTALMILIGFLVGIVLRTAIDMVGTSGAVPWTPPADFAVVGYIIPGLIAIWIERQGLLETTCVVLTAGAMTRLTLILAGIEVIA